MINKYLSLLDSGALETVKTEGAEIISRGMNYVDPTLGHLNSLYNGGTVGASGATYGVLLAFGMIFPNRPIYLMFIPIPIKAKWFVIGYGVIELVQGLGMNQGDNVAHFAHLGGMLFGLLMILYWKKKGTIYGDFY